MTTRRKTHVADPIRRAVLRRIEKNKDFTAPCQCWKPKCVQCAYEHGRRIGHIEAGAYYTAEEVFGKRAWKAARRAAHRQTAARRSPETPQ